MRIERKNNYLTLRAVICKNGDRPSPRVGPGAWQLVLRVTSAVSEIGGGGFGNRWHDGLTGQMPFRAEQNGPISRARRGPPGVTEPGRVWIVRRSLDTATY